MNRLAVVLGVCILAHFVYPCTAAQREPGDEPLPPPPADAKTLEISPKGALQQLEHQQGASRTVFEGLGPGGVRVEVRDVVVGPKATVKLPAVKGPVVIDTRSGEGHANIGDRSFALDIAEVASASANGTIELQNESADPLVLMIYTVEGR